MESLYFPLALVFIIICSCLFSRIISKSLERIIVDHHSLLLRELNDKYIEKGEIDFNQIKTDINNLKSTFRQHEDSGHINFTEINELISDRIKSNFEESGVTGNDINPTSSHVTPSTDKPEVPVRHFYPQAESNITEQWPRIRKINQGEYDWLKQYGKEDKITRNKNISNLFQDISSEQQRVLKNEIQECFKDLLDIWVDYPMPGDSIREHQVPGEPRSAGSTCKSVDWSVLNDGVRKKAKDFYKENKERDLENKVLCVLKPSIYDYENKLWSQPGEVIVGTPSILNLLAQDRSV